MNTDDAPYAANRPPAALGDDKPFASPSAKAPTEPLLDYRAWWDHLKGVAWAAFRSWAGTVLFFAATGVVLGGISYYYLRDNPLYALNAV